MDYGTSIKKTIDDQIKSGVTMNSLIYQSQKWYLKNYVLKNNHNPDLPEPIPHGSLIFYPGKIYTFKYPTPKYEKKLDFLDKYPIMFCLGYISHKGGENIFGINLAYFPPKLRIKVLDKIIKIFYHNIIKYNQNQIAKGKFRNQKLMPITYELAKHLLDGSGFEFALRSYIPDLLGNKPAIITYEDWWKVTLFSSKFIEKLNKLIIYTMYRQSAFDSKHRIGKKIPEKEKQFLKSK